MKRFALTTHFGAASLPRLYYQSKRDAVTCAHLLVSGAYSREEATAVLSEWIEGKGYVNREEYYWDERRVWSRPPKPLPEAK